jgi:predicted nucleic acid-binding protein
MATPPVWLDIKDVGAAPDASLVHFDAGERDTITLAQAMQADLLLMDEWEGWREAARRALTVTGVLGVLERAAQRELIDLPSAVTRLLVTNFYAPATWCGTCWSVTLNGNHGPPPESRRGVTVFPQVT